jgi:hypothetical protein
MLNNPEAGGVSPSPPIARSAAAQRMHAHRQRRREGLRCLTIEIREAEIDKLIQKGLLKEDTRNDLHAIRNALYAHLDRTLGRAAWCVIEEGERSDKRTDARNVITGDAWQGSEFSASGQALSRIYRQICFNKRAFAFKRRIEK